MSDDAQHVARDLRVCALGDSFVAGVGDPEHRGWVGRAAAGTACTLYNLGVRRDTSADVLARWAVECAPRLVPGCDGRVLLSFGVNDTTDDGDGVRVPIAESAANLRTVLGTIAAAGHAAMVVGPPPVADLAQNARIVAVSRAFGSECGAVGVPFTSVVDALLVDPVWTSEVAAGDGAHPGAAGYARLAELVRPSWRDWTRP